MTQQREAQLPTSHPWFLLSRLCEPPHRVTYVPPLLAISLRRGCIRPGVVSAVGGMGAGGGCAYRASRGLAAPSGGGYRSSAAARSAGVAASAGWKPKASSAGLTHSSG